MVITRFFKKCSTELKYRVFYIIIFKNEKRVVTIIQYPHLKERATIGITAPSSGVEEKAHPLLRAACKRLEEKGYRTVTGETAWMQNKAKSAPAQKRANELNEMMLDENINLIIPPWGGELLIEILEYIDFEKWKPKWILGYSDLSVLLLAVTLKTGIATAHGTNLVDLRGKYSDDTTAMWESVLATREGDSILQQASTYYQKTWEYNREFPEVFNLTEKTEWKIVGQATNVKLEGRFLGGCIDVIRHLIGTPFGDVCDFQQRFLDNEPIIWYLENCELNTTDIRRTLVQMKLAGWFNNCFGILFGRSEANTPIEDYHIEDVYKELSEELSVPIVYDIDCGHQPPQITFINGAYGKVHVASGKGTVWQQFRP